MLNNKDYCDYETCVALKELGYSESFPLSKDYEVLGKDYDILLYEAQKWLREEKNICVEMTCCAGGYVWELCKAYNNRTWTSGSTIYTKPNMDNPLLNDCGKYESYEDALLEGIKEAVKILKEK